MKIITTTTIITVNKLINFINIYSKKIIYKININYKKKIMNKYINI